MRKTWGRLLRNLDAFDGDPHTTMITDLAEQEGVDVERIMDALDTLKMFGLYHIDVIEATGLTTIFLDDEPVGGNGPFAPPALTDAEAVELRARLNESLPEALRDAPRFDGGIEVGGTTHVKQPGSAWSPDLHDLSKYDLIFIDGPALRARAREKNAEKATLDDLFVPESYEPSVRHRLCAKCKTESACGLDVYGWQTASPPYNDWRVSWVDPALSVLPECEECRLIPV